MLWKGLIITILLDVLFQIMNHLKSLSEHVYSQLEAFNLVKSFIPQLSFESFVQLCTGCTCCQTFLRNYLNSQMTETPGRNMQLRWLTNSWLHLTSPYLQWHISDILPVQTHLNCFSVDGMHSWHISQISDCAKLVSESRYFENKYWGKRCGGKTRHCTDCTNSFTRGSGRHRYFLFEFIL